MVLWSSLPPPRGTSPSSNFLPLNAAPEGQPQEGGSSPSGEGRVCGRVRSVYCGPPCGNHLPSLRRPSPRGGRAGWPAWAASGWPWGDGTGPRIPVYRRAIKVPGGYVPCPGPGAARPPCCPPGGRRRRPRLGDRRVGWLATRPWEVTSEAAEGSDTAQAGPGTAPAGHGWGYYPGLPTPWRVALVLGWMRRAGGAGYRRRLSSRRAALGADDHELPAAGRRSG